MTRCCCLAAVMLSCLLNGGIGRGDDGSESEGNYSGSLVLDVDRDATDILTAAEAELAAGQTAAGLARLQELLDRRADVLVQHGASYVSLWEVVQQRISRLSAGHLKTYQRIVRAQSESALAAARHPLDPDALARLTDRYRHTPVGRESAILLATLAFDRGDNVTAMAWAEFLRRHHSSVSLPQGFTRRQQSEVAEVRKMPASGSTSSTWSLDLGVAQSARHAIDRAVAELNAQALNPMLTCRPLIVDQRVLTRTLTGLICVDAASGELLWEHPIACHAARLATAPGTLNDPLRTGQISALLLRRLIRDSLEDELATDGKSVFTLITRDRSTEDDQLWPANILRAVDIATGKLQWELKPPPREASRRTRRAAARQARYFLGPPLVDAGQLLLPAQHGQNVELVALDRDSGQVLWTVIIGQAVRDLWAREKPGIADPSPEDRERQSTACRLSRSGSHVLFPTGAGAMACIDASKQRVVWAYRYPRRDLSAPAPSAGDETHFRQMPTRDAFVAAGSWIRGETGVCLAPDADRILAFELSTGVLLWSRPRGDTLQVIAATSESLLLVSEAEVTAIDFRDGRQQWVTPIHRPLGRGIIDNDQLIIPVSDDRFQFLQISDGARIFDPTGEDAGAAMTVSLHPPQSLRLVHLCNLHSTADVIVRQSATSLERVAPATMPDQGGSVGEKRLKSVLIPIAEWHTDRAPLVGALRRLDSRVSLLDGLLVRLFEDSGLKRSLEEQVETLLLRLQRAENDDDTEAARALKRQLAALGPRRLYVTTPDGLHTCRLDCWMGRPAEEIANDRKMDLPEPTVPVAPQTVWPWPETAPRVSERQTNFGLSYLQRVPIDEQGPGVWSDVTVEADRQGRMLQLHDPTSADPSVFLLPRESGTFRLQPRFLQGWARGNVLLLRIGTELVAFHRTQPGLLPASTLWPADGQTLSLLGHRPPLPTSLQERPEDATRAWDNTSSGIEDVFGRAVGDVGPVRERYLCYQQRGDIIALHTQTGEELWRRARWPVGTRCIGDDRGVVVFHPEHAEVIVLDAADGRTQRQWSIDEVLDAPPVSRRTPFAPRQINGNLALLSRAMAGQLQLEVLDMVRGETIWRKEVSAGTIDFAVDASRLGLAVPSNDQKACSVLLLDWTTGEQKAAYEVAGPENLQTVHTFSDARQRYLILSGRITDLPLQNVPQIRGGLNRPLVNGWLHAFDVGATQVRWSQPLENVAFPVVQPRHVPLLVINDVSQPAGTQTPRGRLLCLDARTGESVAEVRQATHVYYTLDAAPDDARIDIRLQGRTLQLDYRDGAAFERE